MSFRSETYRVLIASPSDLLKERQIATEVIQEWNAQHSDAESVVLLPVKWETHAMPQAGIAPQEAINSQLVNKCDILIGMFWTKLGTKTGAADSGTVEEIDRFVGAGKPALLYFSSRPIDPNKIDYAQHKKLKKFREDTYKKALIGTFNQPNKWRPTLLRDLLRQIREIKGRIQQSDSRAQMLARSERLAARDEVNKLTERLNQAQVRLAEHEILKQHLAEVTFRLKQSEARLGESESIRQTQLFEWEQRTAELNSKLVRLETQVGSQATDALARDQLLIGAIVEQLNYAKTFTDTLNLVQLLANIGQRCSATDRARKLFGGMASRNHYTGSKIDYNKVAQFLLQG